MQSSREVKYLKQETMFDMKGVSILTCLKRLRSGRGQKMLGVMNRPCDEENDDGISSIRDGYCIS